MSRITRSLGVAPDREGNPAARYRIRIGKSEWLVSSSAKTDRTYTVAWRVKGNGTHARMPEHTLRDGGIERMCSELLRSPLERPRSALTLPRPSTARADSRTVVHTFAMADGTTMDVALRQAGRANIVRMRIADADGNPVVDDEAYGWETLDGYLASKGFLLAPEPTPLSLLEGELSANGMTIRDVEAYTRCDDPAWAAPLAPGDDTPGLIAWTDRDVWFTARDENGETYFDHVPRNPADGGKAVL